MKWYAVKKGRIPGIYESWDECKEQVNKFSGAEYKSFTSWDKANRWLTPQATREENSDIEGNVHFVFTDGGCLRNGKHDAVAGLGVYFGEGDSRNFSGRIFGKQTNNTAEIKAILKACYILKDEILDGDIVNIYSDSVYAIRAAGEYGEKQEKGGWEKDIPNKHLVKKIYNLFKKNDNLHLHHVPAHTGGDDWLSKGNERADKLASEALL